MNIYNDDRNKIKQKQLLKFCVFISNTHGWILTVKSVKNEGNKNKEVFCNVDNFGTNLNK